MPCHDCACRGTSPSAADRRLVWNHRVPGSLGRSISATRLCHYRPGRRGAHTRDRGHFICLRSRVCCPRKRWESDKTFESPGLQLDSYKSNRYCLLWDRSGTLVVSGSCYDSARSGQCGSCSPRANGLLSITNETGELRDRTRWPLAELELHACLRAGTRTVALWVPAWVIQSEECGCAQRDETGKRLQKDCFEISGPTSPATQAGTLRPANN